MVGDLALERLLLMSSLAPLWLGVGAGTPAADELPRPPVGADLGLERLMLMSSLPPCGWRFGSGAPPADQGRLLLMLPPLSLRISGRMGQIPRDICKKWGAPPPPRGGEGGHLYPTRGGGTGPGTSDMYGSGLRRLRSLLEECLLQ